MTVPTTHVLVTGGAGFLGSHLVDAILAKYGDKEGGVEVTVVDNLQTGSLRNLDHVLNSTDDDKGRRVRFVQCDVVDLRPECSDPAVQEVLETPFKLIFHLACAASPPLYQRDPVHTLRTCFEGTLNVLHLAQRHGARMLFTGTSEVYGDPLVTPQPETYWGNVNCTGVRACYDEGKRVAEALITSFHAMHGTEVRIARIFNTYGPRMSFEDGRVISNFVFQALRGQPLTVYGDGLQTRSFCYVSDQIAGLMALMDQDATIGPVNIGNPDEYTVLEMAHTVRKVVHNSGLAAVDNLDENSSPVVHMDLPSDDPKQRRPDISLAKRVLGWEPRVSLEEGLRLTVEEFAQRLPEWIENEKRRRAEKEQQQQQQS